MNLFYLLWSESDTFSLSSNFIWAHTVLILHSLITSVLVTFLCFYLSHISVHCIQKIQTLKKSVVWKVGESHFFSFKTLEKTSCACITQSSFRSFRTLFNHIPVIVLFPKQEAIQGPSQEELKCCSKMGWYSSSWLACLGKEYFIYFIFAFFFTVNTLSTKCGS